ncbi:hypothetical protein BpHYR1_043600, partial [Brachionus plicatilis]
MPSIKLAGGSTWVSGGFDRFISLGFVASAPFGFRFLGGFVRSRGGCSRAHTTHTKGPLGRCLSGGVQHSLWKPRSHLSH